MENMYKCTNTLVFLPLWSGCPIHLRLLLRSHPEQTNMTLRNVCIDFSIDFYVVASTL